MRKTTAIVATLLWVLIGTFTVAAVTVTDVYNAPNPLVTETTFYLVYYPPPHSFYSVVIKVYDLGSQQVAQPNAQNTDRVTWNGTDFDEDELANGGYLYKVYVYELQNGVPYLFWQSSIKTMFISR